MYKCPIASGTSPDPLLQSSTVSYPWFHICPWSHFIELICTFTQNYIKVWILDMSQKLVDIYLLTTLLQQSA